LGWQSPCHSIQSLVGSDVDECCHLVGVTVGMFDDAKGLVQVTDTDLEPGQKIVGPRS